MHVKIIIEITFVINLHQGKSKKDLLSAHSQCLPVFSPLKGKKLHATF